MDQYTIKKLGFIKNTKVINGFKPHFKKGKDLLFLIGADYWPGKIYRIDSAYKLYEGNVLGILTDKSPRSADKDWVTADILTLLELNPLSVGQWNKQGTDIEFAEIFLF